MNLNLVHLNLIPSSQSLGSLPEEVVWLADFNSFQSKETYKAAILQFMHFMGFRSLEELREINGAHVVGFKNYLRNQGKSFRTINNRISALSSLFNHLVDKQLLKYNPAKGIKRFRVNHDRVESKVMSREEARTMLDAPLYFNEALTKGVHQLSPLQIQRDRALLHIFFYAGCRISEACKLKVKDYYEEQGYFLLDFQLKGGKKNRVAIHQELQIALNNYLKIAGHSDRLEEPLIQPVFSHPLSSGKHLSRQQVDKIWKKYAKFTGIKGITPHSARTTFATNALENGSPIDATQRTLGHSQISTTQMYDQRSFPHRMSSSFSVGY